jgi:glycine betaine/proline transport system ATP-binding protein
MPKIECRNISKIFGRRPKEVLGQLSEQYDKEEIFSHTGHKVGVCRASLNVEDGEIFTIIGMPDSGKSTLLRCINLLALPTDGELLIDGEDILKYNRRQQLQLRRKKIAMVFEHFGLLTHRNVLENVTFGLEINRLNKAQRLDKAKAALSLLGLKGQENTAVSELDTGDKLRVGLARALAGDWDILLMDDPFTPLDPILRRDMQFELLKIQKNLKKTIILVTHDINEAFKLGNHIAVMKDGQIIQTGTPEEILKAPANMFISDFIMDVDKTKVITAKNIMTLPASMVFDHTGPHWAIKEMKANGLSSVFVIDNAMHLKGLVTLDGAIDAINRCVPIGEVIITDIPTTSPDTSVSDLLISATHAKYPISVIDEEQRFLGIVTRAAVMSSLVNF